MTVHESIEQFGVYPPPATAVPNILPMRKPELPEPRMSGRTILPVIAEAVGKRYRIGCQADFELVGGDNIH